MKKRALKLFLIAVIGFFSTQIAVESVKAIGSMAQMEASIPQPDGCACEAYLPLKPHLATCLQQSNYDNGQLMSRNCVDGQYPEENCECANACGAFPLTPCDNPD